MGGGRIRPSWIGWKGWMRCDIIDTDIDLHFFSFY